MANSSVSASNQGLLGRGPNNWYQSCSVPIFEAHQWQSQSIHGGSPELHQFQSNQGGSGASQGFLQELQPDPVLETQGWQSQDTHGRSRASPGSPSEMSPSPSQQFGSDLERARGRCSTGHSTWSRASPIDCGGGSWQTSPHSQSSCSTNGKIPQHKDSIDRMIDKFDHMNSQLDLVLEELGRQREKLESQLYREVSLPNSCMNPNPSQMNLSNVHGMSSPMPKFPSMGACPSTDFLNLHGSSSFMDHQSSEVVSHGNYTYDNTFQGVNHHGVQIAGVANPYNIGDQHAFNSPNQYVQSPMYTRSNSQVVPNHVYHEKNLQEIGSAPVGISTHTPPVIVSREGSDHAHFESSSAQGQLKQPLNVQKTLDLHQQIAHQYEEPSHMCVNVSASETEDNVIISDNNCDDEEEKKDFPVEQDSEFTSRYKALEQSNKKNDIDAEFQTIDDEVQLTHVAQALQSSLVQVTLQLYSSSQENNSKFSERNKWGFIISKEAMEYEEDKSMKDLLIMMYETPSLIYGNLGDSNKLNSILGEGMEILVSNTWKMRELGTSNSFKMKIWDPGSNLQVECKTCLIIARDVVCPVDGLPLEWGDGYYIGKTGQVQVHAPKDGSTDDCSTYLLLAGVIDVHVWDPESHGLVLQILCRSAFNNFRIHVGPMGELTLDPEGKKAEAEVPVSSRGDGISIGLCLCVRVTERGIQLAGQDCGSYKDQQILVMFRHKDFGFAPWDPGIPILLFLQTLNGREHQDTSVFSIENIEFTIRCTSWRHSDISTYEEDCQPKRRLEEFMITQWDPGSSY